MRSDSVDYTYRPTLSTRGSIQFVPSHPYGDAAALLDNAVEPTAVQSAAAAHQAAQDRRLDALESCTHFLLDPENERMLKLEEAVVVLQAAVGMLLDQKIEQLSRAGEVQP